jgi:hypothetical protein
MPSNSNSSAALPPAAHAIATFATWMFYQLICVELQANSKKKNAVKIQAKAFTSQE